MTKDQLIAGLFDRTAFGGQLAAAAGERDQALALVHDPSIDQADQLLQLQGSTQLLRGLKPLAAVGGFALGLVGSYGLLAGSRR